jgi:hypothetical protein
MEAESHKIDNDLAVQSSRALSRSRDLLAKTNPLVASYPVVAKKLTLAEVELVARNMAPVWWASLTPEDRLDIVQRYNEAQAAEELVARTLQGPPKHARL